MVFRFKLFNLLSDLLSMDKDNMSYNNTPAPEGTPFVRVENTISNKLCTIITPQTSKTNAHLENIRKFWIAHPRKCINNYSDTSSAISSDEYLLYGKALMLWAFGKCSPIREADKYPVYFVSDCHISNPQKLHISLIDDGYLNTPTIYEVLQSNKMPDLKIIAESIGCSKGGSKADLINRIADNLSMSDKENYIAQCNCYSLSDKGSTFLQSNFDLVELHRHSRYNISLSEFYSNRFIGNRKRTFYDNAYHILTNRIFNNCRVHCYTMMQHDYRSLYEIALNEYRYDLATEFYLRSLYLKTCCEFDATYYSQDYYSEPNFSRTTIFSPKDAIPFAELGEFYHPNVVLNIYNDLSLPPSFLTKDEFCDAVSEMISETMFDFEKYNNIIRYRLANYAER